MKENIYDQAVLEGVATSFPQTEEILESGQVNGMTASDVQKILNLKHAWEFILDNDVIQAKSDYYVLCHIARMVNEGFFADGGRIRGVPVTIGGSSYIPPLPIEADIKDEIEKVLLSDDDDIDKAIRLCLYVMKAQVFIDGNKRAAVIYANHFLIAHGQGFLVIPEGHVAEFRKLLVSYYEGAGIDKISEFLKERCWKTF
jgi:fido (protein-threonine AMPylation protein)